jgi:hypothetical protein
VRHQPVVAEHGLFVPHAVRSSQLDARILNAAIGSQSSAAPGYSSLMDPFALGAPEAIGVQSPLVSELPAQDGDKSAVPVKTAAVEAEATDQKAVAEAETPVPAKLETAKRPAAGFRSQLEQFAKDRKQSARPITRTSTVKI